jgi:acetyltransferase
MSIENLDKIFQPNAIAVVGASERQGSIGAALMRNLIDLGFGGDIYPINPRYARLWDRAAHTSLKDLNIQVDLAVVATPIESIPQIVRDCVELNVGGLVIISAGGKEIGEEGKKMETAIHQEVGSSGLRIIGPNCVGIMSSRSRLNASFAGQMPLAGKMAFISQSGAICTAILDLSIRENIGFSYFVSLGDMLDVDFGDMIDYLGADPEVSSIVMYVESLTHIRKFMSAARAVSCVKPIIALKAGRTRAGALAAASHTGALAGEDSFYDAAFQRAGILRVKTFEELFDCAELLAKQPKPKGPGLAIITNAGGLGVMAADTLAEYGHEPVALGEDTLKKLNEILPPFWSKRNPIDILGDAPPDLFRQVVQICTRAKKVDGVLIMSAPLALADSAETARGLVDLIRDQAIPIVTAWVGGANIQKARDIFNQAGIATFDTPERAVRAFMDIYRFSQNIEVLEQIPSRLARRLEFDRKKAKALIGAGPRTQNRLLTETESKALLSAYGIPVARSETAGTPAGAVKIAKDIGFPVVLKINSRDISHKSDAKGVFLDLNNSQEVLHAYEQIAQNAKAYDPKARLEGVTIQPMIQHNGLELILGVKKDRDFGPVILFGMGGIFTEVFKDRAIALPPLNRLLAKKLIEQTRLYRVLQGYRNILPANLDLLEEILVRLAQLAIDFSHIQELDINPLVVTENGFSAVDARILLKSSEKQAPMHLIISPYPDQYEEHITTNTGVDIFIRPIRPEDAPLLVELFESLSPRSVYLRFFTPMKSLPHSMLARFTQIDYDRHIALVALAESQPEEKMLGVARVILGRNLLEAEFSVVVSDPWHGKGIGADLLQRCLSIAKERRIQKVRGTVLAENTQMLALGRKLGFEIKKEQGVPEYELSIDFGKN